MVKCVGEMCVSTVGQQLARHIYDHGLGMQDEQTITIRKLDGDFWDQFPDDPATTAGEGG